MEGVPALPVGAQLRPLAPHADDRGSFLEVFREEWGVGVEPVQWNAVYSEAGVLRGVHVHPIHDDYLVVVQGRAVVGLRDLRPGSATDGLVTVLEASGDAPAAVVIPHGVAHGFYFAEPSIHLYAVTHYWNTADELGCRWDDPELAIPWPIAPRLLSERDRRAGSFAELREAVVSGLGGAGPGAA